MPSSSLAEEKLTDVIPAYPPVTKAQLAMLEEEILTLSVDRMLLHSHNDILTVALSNAAERLEEKTQKLEKREREMDEERMDIEVQRMAVNSMKRKLEDELELSGDETRRMGGILQGHEDLISALREVEEERKRKEKEDKNMRHERDMEIHDRLEKERERWEYERKMEESERSLIWTSEMKKAEKERDDEVRMLCYLSGMSYMEW